jgi:hypothetical protein
MALHAGRGPPQFVYTAESGTSCRWSRFHEDKQMKKILALAVFALVFARGLAIAQNSSPYVVGQWNLQDKFKDFKGHGDAIVTENSAFTFINPTGVTLTLEYAFFAPDGAFCGCDRDTLSPNGRTRYTMLAEQQGGQFSTKLCPTQTDGTLKSIVFVPAASPSFGTDGALQAGLQIRIDDDQRTESDLDAVPVTPKTISEMSSIHA